MPTTLTPRQQQIKKLLDSGKTPVEAAKKLKITENAIYQHMRRIRAANGETPAKRGSSKRSGASKRSSRGKRSSSPRPAPAAANPPTPVVREMTPLQAIRHRKGEIESALKESEQRVAAARKTLAHEEEGHAKLAANRADELKQLEKAESALTGKPIIKTAPKAKRQNGSGSKAAGRQAASQAAPAAPQPEPTPEPEPEPVAPPEGEEAAALVGAEERPGVPVDPDFDQGGQDGFGEEG